MPYLLDTNICIFFLRGVLNFDQIFREKDIKNCFISEITVFELKYGAQSSDNPDKSHNAVDLFVRGLSVIPIYSALEKYVEIKLYLKKRGTPLHDEFDLLMGSTALANNLILVTDNTKDFKIIQGLNLENWY